MNQEYENIETLLKQIEIGTQLPVDEKTSYNDDLHELIKLMPAVTERLKEYRCLDTYLKWCRFISILIKLFLYRLSISGSTEAST